MIRNLTLQIILIRFIHTTQTFCSISLIVTFWSRSACIFTRPRGCFNAFQFHWSNLYRCNAMPIFHLLNLIPFGHIWEWAQDWYSAQEFTIQLFSSSKNIEFGAFSNVCLSLTSFGNEIQYNSNKNSYLFNFSFALIELTEMSIHFYFHYHFQFFVVPKKRILEDLE